MKKGLIIKLVSGAYTVLFEDSTYVTKPRGVFRHQEISPLVGDEVLFSVDELLIYEVLPRRNELIRPPISNVDKAFLVFSIKEPNLNLNLLDRMISIVEYNDITPIIIFTKLDLLKDRTEFEIIKGYYEKIGYKVIEVDLNSELNSEIIAEINNSISVLAGQSGVGKSTLLNRIEPSFNLRTNEISYALGRGKHTTRHVELLKVANGLIADTPGFGIAAFEKMDLLTFADTFIEFFKLRSDCRFNQCIHQNEPGCKVKSEVEKGNILASRYNNYLIFLEEIKQLQTKY